ncbi:hypothetical protein [Flavobacteriaceae bacterium 14752]|uniref:hypothetical protein n=1 Tax=Mesohalobacter salilacus TaxID=2491711 RepID=UPI000F644C9B|nr:hypothetical protein EIG84_05360 [Flavobacteriaceae bacterium 14752]
MKQTFTHKYFDWILIGLSLIFSVLTLMNIFREFEFFSSFLLRIVFVLVSLTALISLLINNFNGERFSRIFVIVYLIFPGILFLNQFLTDIVIYGINRLNPLQNPTLILKLIGGIALLYFSIKFSKQHKNEHIKDYGIIVIGTGIFVILYVVTKSLEPNFVSPDLILAYPIWKTITKTIIGILILVIGFIIKNNKIKMNKALILTIGLIFIFGLL